MSRRRRWGARFLAVLGIAVVVAALAQIFTENPEPPATAEIERSLAAVLDGERIPATCEQMGAAWSCRVGKARYTVVADQDRCWTGERVSRRGRACPLRIDGCVDDVSETDPYLPAID